MAVNRGKDFENVVREAFEKVPNVSIDRLHDQTTGWKGSTNICDFIVYREPYEYYFECKSINRGAFPFSNITDTQWNGLLQKSQIEGVFAGVIVWYIDKDATFFIPIQILNQDKSIGHKSMSCKSCYEYPSIVEITGKKKRIFYEYDMEKFLNEIQYNR